MKNKIYIILFLTSIFFNKQLFGENLKIESSNISIDKKTQTTVFENNVIAYDDKNNELKTEYAIYNKDLKTLKSKGKTFIMTSQGFSLTGDDIIFDNKNNIIKSDKPALLKDLELNEIYFENFEYSTKDNLFKSFRNTKVIDSKKNTYKFSQVYIDENKKEIVGSDVKAYINEKGFKTFEDNKPRVFSNTVSIKNNETLFSKNNFTICNYRKDDKCPPWRIQSKKMLHDKEKKTIYYDNAVLKLYDVPVFYTPRLAHPDSTVARRSGFLFPKFGNIANVGFGVDIPYFWDMGKDKDLTLTSKLFATKHPLFLGEYRKAFKYSNLILDFGHTTNSSPKKENGQSHLFANFYRNIKKENSNNSFELNFQHVADNKYLKRYQLNTKLAKHNVINTLENHLDFTHEEDDLLLGLKFSAYETLDDTYNDKYEYVLPDLVANKNLFSSRRYGNADLLSNLKVHQFDTNKTKKYFINDINWESTKHSLSSLKGQFLGKLKNINYETSNIDDLKSSQTSELFGAFGYLSEFGLIKESDYALKQTLTPKILLRYAPDHMRKSTISSVPSHGLDVFSIDRLDLDENFESGVNATIGLNYNIDNDNKQFDFNIGQIINFKENKNMPTVSSLDEKLSDVIGDAKFTIKDTFNLTYSYAVDQNLTEFNYNELEIETSYDKLNLGFNYLSENKHIGDQEYIKFNADLKTKNGLLSMGTKRSLVTDSAEFYDLSYEYINDCLRAGIVYRREFYNDSELDPENTLMFKITFTPIDDMQFPLFE